MWLAQEKCCRFRDHSIDITFEKCSCVEVNTYRTKTENTSRLLSFTTRASEPNYLFCITGCRIFCFNIFVTRNTFCRTWYRPQSRVHKSIAELCSNFDDSAISKDQIAYVRNDLIFTSGQKSDVIIVFSDSDLLYDAGIFFRLANNYAPSCIVYCACVSK